MQSISNADILDMLLFVEERINTTIERCGSDISVNDFLASPDKMDIFDATCMRLQTIGETVKNIDNLTFIMQTVVFRYHSHPLCKLLIEM